MQYISSYILPFLLLNTITKTLGNMQVTLFLFINFGWMDGRADEFVGSQHRVPEQLSNLFNLFLNMFPLYWTLHGTHNKTNAVCVTNTFRHHLNSICIDFFACDEYVFIHIEKLNAAVYFTHGVTYSLFFCDIYDRICHSCEGFGRICHTCDIYGL